jgi:hypothetical protein
MLSTFIKKLKHKRLLKKLDAFNDFKSLRQLNKNIKIEDNTIIFNYVFVISFTSKLSLISLYGDITDEKISKKTLKHIHKITDIKQDVPFEIFHEYILTILQYQFFFEQ